VVVVSLKLYYSTTTKPFTDSANNGFGKALEYLRKLQIEGFPCKVVATSRLSDEEVYQAYAEAWSPSVSKKFAIRRVFGTRRRSGCFFGKEVPALLVFEDDSEQPVDIYPREELGRTVTTREFLRKLLSDES
jgi:hypothetical protein